LLHFCSNQNKQIHRENPRQIRKPATESEEKFRKRDRVTFFFCLPPPDLAGLDDGGGAFSFFGAWGRTERRTAKQISTPR
jgi:hypothetical protein